MPKTNLQRKVSYYEKIISESKNSPLTPKYKTICTELEQLVEFSKKLNDPQVKMSETDFRQLTDHYRKVHNACQDYFNANTKPTSFENNRNDIMKSIYRMLKKDMAILDKCDPKEPGSLSEIIGRSRTHIIVLKSNDIQKIGGSLNKRIPLKTPDGRKGFFTPTTTYNNDEKWIETINKHFDNLSKYEKIDTSKLEALKTDPKIIHSFCKHCPGRPIADFLKIIKKEDVVQHKIHSVAVVLGVAPGIEEAGKILEADKKGIKQAVIDFIDSMAIMANQYGIMYTAGIKKDSNINTRNCAMSEVAKMIGCGNVVANSAPMKIKIDNNEVEGIFMETAEGSDINNIKDDDMILDAKTSSFNGAKAMNQLTDMQVLDFICGNIDRHSGNIIYQFAKDKSGKVVLSGIKDIDNDCAFGTVNPAPGKNVSQMVSPENMQYIRQDMVDKLETMTESSIRMHLSHYKFSEDELKAAWKRTEQVKEAISQGKIIPIGNDFWEKQKLVQTDTKKNNYFDRIKNIALSCFHGYKKDPNEKYKEVEYMKDRRQSNKVLLNKVNHIATLRQQMDKAKSIFFNSSEYNMMKKRFEQVEKLTQEINTSWKGHSEKIPGDKAAKLEKAYTELADKTLRYIMLKKTVPSSTRGQKRIEFAQKLMEFADDTLQEMTMNPEMEATSKKDEAMEIKENEIQFEMN